MLLQGPDIEVVPPADDRLRFVIDTTAAYVLRDGPDFEQVRHGLRSAYDTEHMRLSHLQAQAHEI
jgi:Surp module